MAGFVGPDAPINTGGGFVGPDAPISDISMPESFGRGVANNFPLAPQAAAALAPINPFSEKSNYSDELSHLTKAAQAAKAANPITYGAGAVTGAVAPLAIPGVGEALEAAPVATNAALGAANAISNTDVLKNPGQALKQGAEGAVTGGALGAIGNKLLPGANAVEALENKASTQAVKTLGLRPGMLAHLEPEEIQDLGTFAREADLVNGDTTSRLAKVQDLKQQVGAQVGEYGIGSTPLQALVLENVPNITEFTDPLQSQAEELAHLNAPDAKTEMGWYINGIKDIQQNGTTFDGLQKLKSYYGDKAFDANHQVVNRAAADVYGQIKNLQKQVVSGAPKEYQDVMTAYKNLSDIESGLSKQLGTERGGGNEGGGMGIRGMIRQIPGMKNPSVAIPAGVAIGAAGHPLIGGLVGLQALNTPATRTAVLSGTAKALPYLKGATEQELNDYLSSKFGGNNANR